MEVLCDHACQESLILQGLFVEIVYHEKNLDDVFFDDFGFESWDLRPHLSLEELHENCEHVLVLVAVGREFDHDLASQYHRAFAEPILHILLDLQIVGSFLSV